MFLGSSTVVFLEFLASIFLDAIQKGFEAFVIEPNLVRG
jgi:hypothetical protein